MNNEQTNINQIPEAREVVVDFEGKTKTTTFEKAKIPEDSYAGRINSINIIDTKKYESNEMKKTIIMQVEPEGMDVEVPLFINPVIVKAYNPKVNNSKLYELLKQAGELQNAQKNGKTLEKYEGLLDFLRDTLEGRNLKFFVKNRKIGTPEEYSSVDRIIGFEDN